MLILGIRSIKIKEAKKKWLSFSREHSTVICVYLLVCCLCPSLECKFHEGKDYKGLSFSPRSSQCPEKCPCSSTCLTNTPSIFGEIMTFIVSPNLRKLVTTKYSRHLWLLLLMSPVSNHSRALYCPCCLSPSCPQPAPLFPQHRLSSQAEQTCWPAVWGAGLHLCLSLTPPETLAHFCSPQSSGCAPRKKHTWLKPLILK